MFKKEWIYREIAGIHLKEKGRKFTELALSKKFGISLSTVHHALAPLKAAGTISPLSRGWRLSGFADLLSYWAGCRKLSRDIIWQGTAASVLGAEKLAPAGAIWGGFTAFKFRHRETPADYSTLILYADESQLAEIRRRMEKGKGAAKLLVLQKDKFLGEYSQGGLCPDAQIYADLWNLPEWQAKEFRNALLKKMGVEG